MTRSYKPLRCHQYHTLSSDSLRYIIQDAGAAAKAIHSFGDPDHPSLSKYADQINDAATILYWRQTSPRWKFGSLGDK